MTRTPGGGRREMHFDRRLLGWGVFLILVGSIPLATRTGVLDPAVVRGWPSLWPLLLVGWGLGLVLRRTPIEWLGGTLTAVVFGLMGGGLLATGFAGGSLATGCGGQAPGKAFATQTGDVGTTARLRFELSCGSLTLRPVDGSSWSVSGTETDGDEPDVRTDGDSVTISARQRGSFLDGRSDRTDWAASIPTSPEISLGITVNAGQSTANLDGAHLGDADLTVNAGSARLDVSHAATLGRIDARVNAGTAVIVLPFDARSANLSMNAGNISVCLAAGTPVRVAWSGALGSNDLDRSGLTKVEDDTWQSADFNPLGSFLDLHVSANAGSFRLHTDGTCDA